MVDINDFNNYKPCRRKQADYWMCIPPKGTIVFNKSEVDYLSKYINCLNSKPFISYVDLCKLKNENQSLYNLVLELGLLVTNDRNVVLYCAGTWRVVSYKYVCDNYMAYHNNSLVLINNIINDRVEDYNKEKVVDWFRVQIKSGTPSSFACFVPVNESGFIRTIDGRNMEYNKRGMSHGKGDFIVCDNVYNKPNLSNRVVVNGCSFALMYDNRGWTDYISISRASFSEPIRLWERQKKSNVENNDTNKNSDIGVLLSWYSKNNLTNHYEFVSSNINKLTSAIISNFMKSKTVVEYIMGKYGFSINSDSFDSVDCIEELKFSNIVLMKDNIVINVYYNRLLCGWNYANDSTYADEPLEMNVSSPSDTDYFINSLIKSLSTYDMILDIIVSSKCSTDIIDYFHNDEERLRCWLNDLKYNKNVLEGFIYGINYVYTKYGVNNEIEVNVGDDFMQFIFEDKHDKGVLTFDLYLDSLPCAWFTVDGKLESKYLRKRNDWVKFMDELHSDCLSPDNDKKVMEPKVTKARYYNTDDGDGFAVCFASGDIKVKCTDDFMDLFVTQCACTNGFSSFITFDDSLEYIDDYDILDASSFFDLFISFLDKNIIKYKFRLQEDLANKCFTCSSELIVLGSTRVGRYFCKISYSFGDRYVNISKSTLDLVKYEFPYLVKFESCEKLNGVKFESLHYYQLVMRLGLFANAFNFKHLKRLYIQYNKDVFEDMLSKDTVCIVGNYSNSVRYNYFETSDASAYTQNGSKFITFNGDYHDLQSSNISEYTKLVMLHEMSHNRTREVYGTPQEKEGEDGGSYYGLDERYKSQWWCHGKRFGESVQVASDGSGYDFWDIFGYGKRSSGYKGGSSHSLVLAQKNAFDFGQKYRDASATLIEHGYYCTVHNKVNCSCNNEKVEFNDTRYIGVCMNCGKLHTFNDSTIGSLCEDSIKYMDVVDRYGVIATSKCSNCSSLLRPIYSDDDELIRLYLEDLHYANKYIDLMLDLCQSNKSKYENYFKRNYGCSLELSRSRMPCLSITVSNNLGFNEKYKFFLSCTSNSKLVGKLYKDYGMDYKGFLIHKFRVNTEKNVLKFFEYVMSYIRKHLKEQ